MKELTRDASLAQYITIAFNAELDKRQTEFYLSNIEVEMIKRNFCALSSLEDDKLIIDIDLNSFEGV